MIEEGSTVILRTKNAIYSTCKVVALSDSNVTIEYFAGMKRDRTTKKMRESRPIETIARKNIVSMSERK